jgi:hypothetical protein
MADREGSTNRADRDGSTNRADTEAAQRGLIDRAAHTGMRQVRTTCQQRGLTQDNTQS